MSTAEETERSVRRKARIAGAFYLLNILFKSAFLPRIVGVLFALAGLGALTVLAPPLARPLFPYFVALGLISEVSLTLWLLVVGVDARQWSERAKAESHG